MNGKKTTTKASVYAIKCRYNPQLGTYYKVMCLVPASEIKAAQKAGSLYGSNSYLTFPTEEAYNAKIAELQAAGERVS